MKSYGKTKQKFLGETFSSNNYGDFVVIKYTNSSNVLILFKNTGATFLTTTSSIKSGCVKDPTIDKVVSKKRKCKYVGNTYTSNNYGEYIVEDEVSCDKVKIRFLNTNHSQHINKNQILTGAVRDYSVQSVRKSNNIIHKVGDKGVDKSLIEENFKVYQVWCSMLQRCYSPTNDYVKRNYKDCEVSDYFKFFPQFLDWWKMKSDGISVDLQLDKDILVKGNRLYSEKTCTLVPRDINMLLIKRNKARGKYPIGVTYCKTSKKYKAQLSKFNVITNLGFYEDIEGAFLAYKQAKEDYIKEVANKYKGVIEDRVYEILMNYEVNIYD